MARDLRRAVATPARGLDHEDVPGLYLHGVTTLHRIDRAILALDPLPSERSVRPAVHAVRRNSSVAAQRADCHRLQEPDPTPTTVASGPAADAPGAGHDLEGLQPDRIAPLQHLGVGEPGVGHVRLHDVGTAEAVPGTGPARDSLVVLRTLVAERHVVHRARPLGLDAERGIERSGDGL